MAEFKYLGKTLTDQDYFTLKVKALQYFTASHSRRIDLKALQYFTASHPRRIDSSATN
jgi:hypothetical protein